MRRRLRLAAIDEMVTQRDRGARGDAGRAVRHIDDHAVGIGDTAVRAEVPRRHDGGEPPLPGALAKPR
jgi:hypothetical protein